MPDFLGGPAMRPLRVHERIPRRGASRSAKLSEVEQLEAVGTEESDPLPYGKRELHRARVGPFQAVQPKESRRRWPAAGLSSSGRHRVRIVPFLRKTRSPPGRRSLAASGTQQYGSHHRLAPYSENAISKPASGRGTFSALP